MTRPDETPACSKVRWEPEGTDPSRPSSTSPTWRTASRPSGIEWVDPKDWTEGPRPFISARIACWGLSLFQAIATRAGENLNYGTYEEAGNTIGAVQIPGYPDPFHYGPPPSADGDPPLYIWTWDPALGAYAIED